MTNYNSAATSYECVLNTPPCFSREILRGTLAADEGEYHRDTWTLFGNEAERVEMDVIRNQHMLRMRIDRTALRKQVHFNKRNILNTSDVYSTLVIWLALNVLKVSKWVTATELQKLLL